MPASTFNSLFEELLEKKQVEVMIPFGGSESLRISLSRRWNQYKERMDALGFLSDDLRHLVLSREKMTVVEGDVSIDWTRFLLKARPPRRTYQILSTNSNTEDGK